MLDDLTQEEFEYMKAALAYAQALGIAKPPGEISYAELAEWFDTHPKDIRIHQMAAIEQIRNHPILRDEFIFHP
jgi:hypothetical protein